MDGSSIQGESSRDNGEGIGDGGMREGRIGEGCGCGQGFGPKAIDSSFDTLSVGDDAGKVTMGMAKCVDRDALEDDGVKGLEEAIVGVINGVKGGVLNDGVEIVGVDAPRG